MEFGFVAGDNDAVELNAVAADEFDSWSSGQTNANQAWLSRNDFKAQPDRAIALPDADGGIAGAVVGLNADAGCYGLAAAPTQLPAGNYRLVGEISDAESLCIGWGLAHYRFNRYKTNPQPQVKLVWPDGVDRARVEGILAAHALTRDLVNTPAEDMGPEALAAAAQRLASEKGASYVEVVGDALLDQGFPAIHAVGRAAAQAPRLADLQWGDSGPRITIVGKGVCFDSGGLDIKGAAGMRWMKKDMGGAAHALALGQLLMDRGVRARIRVLLPIVENAISEQSYRPGDVIATRSGKTVEIGNTDAEGRVVLCDALTLAAEEEPSLILDFATLTGAARVALGPDLPALFANDDAWANAILDGASRQTDPVWRMPLHAGYRSMLDSPIADMNNTATGGFGGAITAALYLQNFVPDHLPWAHLDTYAWNKSSRPGRPEGGEAMGLRATFDAIERHVAD